MQYQLLQLCTTNLRKNIFENDKEFYSLLKMSLNSGIQIDSAAWTVN